MWSMAHHKRRQEHDGRLDGEQVQSTRMIVLEKKERIAVCFCAMKSRTKRSKQKEEAEGEETVSGQCIKCIVHS